MGIRVGRREKIWGEALMGPSNTTSYTAAVERETDSV
jgi:hypothetical protein